MGTVGKQKWDEEYSVIGDKEETDFLDFDDDISMYNYEFGEDGPVVISTPFPFIKGKPQYILVGETSKC